MTSAAATSVALLGMQGTIVEVEAALGAGLPRTVLVGLPDAALYEARDRCRAAVASAGLSWPSQLLTINLTPANLPKAGSHFDLAIVAAVMACAETVPREIAASSLLMGELGLDGRVRPVRGVLPGLLAARGAGLTRAVVPDSQLGEASLVNGMTVWGVRDLADLVEVLHGRPVLHPEPVPDPPAQLAGPPCAIDLSDVVGQPEACWAVEVAAAGGHHLFLHGAPGVGKTMLAERLPTLLPQLSDDEALEVSAIHSLAGRNLDCGLIQRPPFCDPHHSISMPALVGGGSRTPQPGAISLAHRGVLFLDEAPEFNPRALEALRTPLESGMVTIGRAEYHACFPARFQLVLASNPCPCGRFGSVGQACSCTPMAVRRYAQRISGPVLDRVDIHVQMNQPQRVLRRVGSMGPSSREVAARVAQARQRQQTRLAGTPWLTNAEIPGSYLRGSLPEPAGLSLADAAVRRGQLSSRGVDKVIRLAWTIADLAGHDRVHREDLAMAMGLRSSQLVGQEA